MVASFSQIEPYIIQSESTGRNLPSSANYNYPKSTASGYYQITNSTWGGIPSSITGGTQSASQASFAQQQAAAQYLWETNNGYDWLGGGPGAKYQGNSVVIAANNAIMAGQTPNYQISNNVQNLPLAGGSGGALGGDYGGGDGSEPGTTPGGIDPVTGQPDWVLPDVIAGAPVTTGGAGSGGTASGVGSGTTANPQGVVAQSGQGTPIQVNLSPQTAADAQSWFTAPIKAAQNAASSWFASASNWFTRGFLLVLAAIILLVALWHVSGQPSPKQIVAAVAK